MDISQGNGGSASGGKQIFTHFTSALQCFLEEFGKDDSVKLLIKTTGDAKAIQKYVRERVAEMTVEDYTPQVEVVTEDLPERGVFEIHQKGDVFVSLCRFLMRYIFRDNVR